MCFSPDEVTGDVPDGGGSNSLCHPHGLESPAVPTNTCGMNEKYPFVVVI